MAAVTHEAMRGPSAWSVADRELMAAVVAQANACAFCTDAHSAAARQAYGGDEKVAAVLSDTSGVSRAHIEDALAVAFAFNVIARLAEAFGFVVPNKAAMEAGAKFLLARGYR